MKIICISGKAQSGKDTVAKILHNHNCYQLQGHTLVTHYADLLKFMCLQLFDWNGEKNTYGRWLLQYVGTDVIRRQCPDFWVSFIIQELQFFPKAWEYVIIPDCRFPNEIDRLKEAGFEVKHIRIARSQENNLTENQRTHISETALNDVVPDYIIQNDGSMEDLERKVKECFDALFQENPPEQKAEITEEST